MHARKLVFVLASAWVCSVAFCTGVRMLFKCSTIENVYIPVKHFPTLEARMLQEKIQLLP
jgi:hypothetical protein